MMTKEELAPWGDKTVCEEKKERKEKRFSLPLSFYYIAHPFPFYRFLKLSAASAAQVLRIRYDGGTS